MLQSHTQDAGEVKLRDSRKQVRLSGLSILWFWVDHLNARFGVLTAKKADTWVNLLEKQPYVDGWRLVWKICHWKDPSDIHSVPIQSPPKWVLKWVLNSPTPIWDTIGFDPQPYVVKPMVQFWGR